MSQIRSLPFLWLNPAHDWLKAHLLAQFSSVWPFNDVTSSLVVIAHTVGELGLAVNVVNDTAVAPGLQVPPAFPSAVTSTERNRWTNIDMVQTSEVEPRLMRYSPASTFTARLHSTGNAPPTLLQTQGASGTVISYWIDKTSQTWSFVDITEAYYCRRHIDQLLRGLTLPAAVQYQVHCLQLNRQQKTRYCYDSVCQSDIC